MKYSMNLVYKSFYYVFFSALFIGSAPAQTGQSQTPEFDRLIGAFEDNRVFTALFSHEYNDSFTGEQQYSEGRIWIGKDRYKIEGNNQLMVVDGETSTVYDGAKNRVIISDYIEEEDDFAPSRMLQGVDDSFAVMEEKRPDNKTQISLTSDDPFSIFLNVRIILSESGEPEQIEAIDQVENELITRFREGEFADGQEEMFTLEIPADAEYIDLRQGS
jgi:outer membrane lipoprotein-sorting protein